MPFFVPRTVLETLGGLNQEHFPIFRRRPGSVLASGNSTQRAVVARIARIHRYGWREVSLDRTTVRASMSDGAERARRMARQRIRFHVLRCRGLPRLSA
jgi:hypothetical protein